MYYSMCETQGNVELTSGIEMKIVWCARMSSSNLWTSETVKENWRRRSR
jgi:hypothetical protein